MAARPTEFKTMAIPEDPEETAATERLDRTTALGEEPLLERRPSFKTMAIPEEPDDAERAGDDKVFGAE